MRDRILMAAFEEINTQGVRFTMADLAKRLAVSKSTIYQLFLSKEALIEAIVDAILEDVRQQEEMIANDPNLSFLQKIEGLLAVFPKVFGPISERFIIEVDRFFPEVRAKAEPLLKEKWVRVEDLVRGEIDAGRLRPVNLAVLQRVFLLVGNGLIDYKFLIENNLSAREAAAAFADIITFGLMQIKKDR